MPTLRKISAAVFYGAQPTQTKGERPAVAREWRIITEGRQGLPATYEVDCICDDLIVRTFLLDAGGLRQVMP